MGANFKNVNKFLKFQSKNTQGIFGPKFEVFLFCTKLPFEKLESGDFEYLKFFQILG